MKLLFFSLFFGWSILCAAETLGKKDYENRQPAANALDGDVIVKADNISITKANIASNTEVTQVVDKTRGVVCYLISNQMSCVKYDK